MNAGGRIVDYLRSTYSATMRISLDPLIEMPVLWYHVPETNPPAPDHQIFRSKLWRPVHWDDGGLGEIDTGEYPWSSGAELGPEPVTPFAGSDSDWLNGV